MFSIQYFRNIFIFPCVCGCFNFTFNQGCQFPNSFWWGQGEASFGQCLAPGTTYTYTSKSDCQDSFSNKIKWNFSHCYLFTCIKLNLISFVTGATIVLMVILHEFVRHTSSCNVTLRNILRTAADSNMGFQMKRLHRDSSVVEMLIHHSAPILINPDFTLVCVSRIIS